MPPSQMEVRMLVSQIVFATAVVITVASGTGAVALVVLSDPHREPGRRLVAARLAQIAVLGATAIFASLHPS